MGTAQASVASERLTLGDVLVLVGDEVRSAEEQHPRGAAGPHEGWAILREEVDELWDLVKADQGRSPEAQTEAVQIAAMAIRYILEVPNG